LFRLIAAAYERRSVAIASHTPFDQWGKFLPDQPTAVSLLDRLCHHAHIITTTGDSYRLRHRTTGRKET
jgi:DNA replication protein DnaC